MGDWKCYHRSELDMSQCLHDYGHDGSHRSATVLWPRGEGQLDRERKVMSDVRRVCASLADGAMGRFAGARAILMAMGFEPAEAVSGTHQGELWKSNHDISA